LHGHTANRLIATRRARRWRSALAAYAFIALAWPSLGPLPGLVALSVAHAAQAHAPEHRHDGQQ